MKILRTESLLVLIKRKCIAIDYQSYISFLANYRQVKSCQKRPKKKKRKLFSFSFNEYKGEKLDIPQMNASQLSPNDSLLIMIEANFSCIHIDFYSLMKCVLFFAFL